MAVYEVLFEKLYTILTLSTMVLFAHELGGVKRMVLTDWGDQKGPSP